MYTIIGDLHLKHDNLDKAEKILQQVEELGNPTIFLGDQLDTKELIRGKCLNFLFNYFKKSKLKHYVIIGNHCYFNLDCKEHSQEVLKTLDNVVIIDDFIKISDNMYGLPYINDVNKLKKFIKKVPKNSVLFLHQDIKGFDYGNGFICKEGVTTNLLKDFKVVVSGHFHKFQQKGNLTYLGTPFTHSFGEANQTKYIATLEEETNKLELIETDFPKHVSFDINCNKIEDLDSVFKPNLNGLERLVLTGTSESISLFKKSNNLKGLKVLERPEEEKVETNLIDETLDNVKQFEKWANNIKKISPEVTSLGMSILKGI